MCSSKQGLPHKLAKLVVTLLNAVVVKVCPSFVFRLLHLRCWFVYRMVFLLVCIQQAGRVCGFSLAFSLVFCSTILLFFFSSNGTVFLVWFSSSACCLFCFNRTVPYTTDCTCTVVPKGLRMKMVKRLSGWGGGGIHIRMDEQTRHGIHYRKSTTPPLLSLLHTCLVCWRTSLYITTLIELQIIQVRWNGAPWGLGNKTNQNQRIGSLFYLLFIRIRILPQPRTEMPRLSHPAVLVRRGEARRKRQRNERRKDKRHDGKGTDGEGCAASIVS